MFDKKSEGLLNEHDFHRSMTAMHLSLSNAEIKEVFTNISVDGTVQLNEFGVQLVSISQQVQATEEWGYQRIIEMMTAASSVSIGINRGSSVKITGLKNSPYLNGMDGVCEGWDAQQCRWIIRLSNGDLKSIKDANLQVGNESLGITRSSVDTSTKDTSALYRRICGDDPSGVVSEMHFLSAVQEMLPRLVAKEIKTLYYLSPKNVDGCVDVRGLLSIVGDRAARKPSSLDEITSPVFSTRPGTPSSPTKRRTDPSIVPPPPPLGAPVTMGRSLGVSTGAATVDIALFRLHRRLEEHRVQLSSMLALFHGSSQAIQLEELLEACSVIPLGLSRVEMEKVFLAHEDGSGGVNIDKLEKEVNAHSGYSSPEDIAFERIQFQKLSFELKRLDSKDLGRVSPQDFRMVLMQTEGYLTSTELEFLLAITDKDGDGNVVYVSFLQRHDTRKNDAVYGKSKEIELTKWLPQVSIMSSNCYPSLTPAMVNQVLAERIGIRLKECKISIQDILRIFLPPDKSTVVSLELLAKVFGYLPFRLSLIEAGGLACHICERATSIPVVLVEKKLSASTGAMQELYGVVAARLGPRILATSPNTRSFSLGASEYITQQQFRKCISEAALTRQEEEKCLLVADKNPQGRIRWDDFVTKASSNRSNGQPTKRIPSEDDAPSCCCWKSRARRYTQQVGA